MIRRATEKDICAIRAIAGIAFPDTYRTILSRDQLDYMMEWMYSEESLARQFSSGHIFLIEDSKGYVSYRRDSAQDDGVPVFHLEKLYILPEFQKQGLGKKLFDAVAEEIRKDTKTDFIIELNVNISNPSIGFYRHLGMHVARSGDFPIGNGYFMNDYIMAKVYLCGENSDGK